MTENLQTRIIVVLVHQPIAVHCSFSWEMTIVPNEVKNPIANQLLTRRFKRSVARDKPSWYFDLVFLILLSIRAEDHHRHFV